MAAHMPRKTGRASVIIPAILKKNLSCFFLYKYILHGIPTAAVIGSRICNITNIFFTSSKWILPIGDMARSGKANSPWLKYRHVIYKCVVVSGYQI